MVITPNLIGHNLAALLSQDQLTEIKPSGLWAFYIEGWNGRVKNESAALRSLTGLSMFATFQQPERSHDKNRELKYVHF